MRSDSERLEDILEMCRNLREHVLPRVNSLSTDPVLLAATERWIEILGEAMAGVSAELRAEHPDVPWREAIATRNILAHGYFGVDLSAVRGVVERDVPQLELKVTAILEELR